MRSQPSCEGGRRRPSCACGGGGVANAVGALARDRELRVWAVAFLLVPLAWSPLLIRTFGFTFLGVPYHLLPLAPAWAMVAGAGQARAVGWRWRLGLAAVIA